MCAECQLAQSDNATIGTNAAIICISNGNAADANLVIDTQKVPSLKKPILSKPERSKECAAIKHIKNPNNNPTVSLVDFF